MTTLGIAFPTYFTVIHPKPNDLGNLTKWQ